MPSSSKKQHKFMEAIAHNKAFAKKVGIPQSVGQDFSKADKGKTFKKGGDIMATKRNPKMMAALMSARRKPVMPVGGEMGADNQMMQAGTSMPGTPAMPMKKGGKVKKMAKGGMAKDDTKQDKAMIKKAFKQHDAQEHKGGKGTKLALKKGGVAKKVTKEMEYDYKTGKKSFRGTTAQRDAHAEKEGKIVAKHAAYDKTKKMAGGGLAAGHKDANGVAKKGLTRAMMPKMSSGGKTKKYC
jgi:hypothetical protein